jgi:hypothetical protein
MEASIHRQIAAVRDAVSWHPRLRVMESVQRVVITDDTIKVLVNRARVTETSGRYKITHRGTELIVWKRNEAGRWGWPESMLDWTEVEEEHLKFGIASIQEQADKRAWERDCYRPGTSRTPMDGPEAVAQLAEIYTTTTPKEN